MEEVDLARPFDPTTAAERDVLYEQTDQRVVGTRDLECKGTSASHQ